MVIMVKTTHKKTAILICVLLFLALFLRSLNLIRGFEGDEAVTLSSASTTFFNIVPELIKHDGYPPLTAVTLHFWMKISESEIFIRYYFILFGTGVLLGIYLITYELFNKDKKKAIFALFLATLSPLLIFISQFIRGYINSAFFMLMSCYFLLLIIRNKGTRWNWLGYLVFSILSIYTFYFAATLLISQTIYIFIFKFKDSRIIKKWLMSQIAIVLVFLPWLPIFLTQFFNKSACKYLPWERFGFGLFGFDLGTYARNISSLFGFDYFFMVFPQGIRNHFSLPILVLMAISAFLFLFFFIYYSLKWLKKEFKNDGASVWFLPCLSLLPVVISWVSIKTFRTTSDARYLIAPHALFLILISYFFYNLIFRPKYKKIAWLLLFLFIFFYVLRIPAAVTPIYEGKKALAYLQQHLRQGDCTVMAIDYLPGRERLPVPALSIGKYIMETDTLTAEYRELPEDKSSELQVLLKPFMRIWFISCYGNTEIFGSNRIVYDFLKRLGRKEVHTKEFHNYKLILME